MRWKAVVLAAFASVALTGMAAPKGKKADQSGYSTLTFKRPFVVPVGDELATTGMVVVSFNVQVDSKSLGKIQEREELLRDRVLSALMLLSHQGEFNGGITDPEIAQMIKETVQKVMEENHPGETGEVLIQDLLSRRVL